MHLVPFGEFVPLQRLLFFVGPLVEQVGGFSPGRDMVMLPTTYGPISTAICYEIVFPRLVRESVLRGSQLLTTITNDAWYGHSVGAVSTFPAGADARNRARPLSGAGRPIQVSAASSIPYGRVLRRSEIFEREILVGEVRMLESRTIYGRIGDLVAYVCPGVDGGGAVFLWRHQWLSLSMT